MPARDDSTAVPASSNAARLHIHSPVGELDVALGSKAVRLGRGEENTVVLSDPRVSREHVVIEAEGAGARFSDLGSQNGTWWRGQRCTGGVLAHGDSIRIGGTTVRFESGVTAATTATAAPVVDASIEILLRLDEHVVLDPQAPDLLERVLDAAIACTASERGFVLEHRPSGMMLAAARGLDGDDVPSAERELSWSIAIRVATSGDDLMLADARNDGRFSGNESVENLGLRSVLCVPIRTQAGIRAVIYLEHRGVAGAYSGQQRLLLRLFANRAALALQARDSIAATVRQLSSAEARNARQAIVLQQRDVELETLKQGHHIDAGSISGLLGNSDVMVAVRAKLARMALTDLPVLLSGESGTGKELAAHALHAGSARRSGPFLTLSCAAVPEALVENELFGHRRGAYTGADEGAPGMFEAAHGGTLFLDGISEMSLAVQASLLRVLEQGVIRRIGERNERSIDVRIIAATRDDLAALVRNGTFREDLYYRLHVLELVLPPLREHPADIPELAVALLQRHASLQCPELTPAALGALAVAHWPGNVRQLENEMRRVAAGGSKLIEVADLDLSGAAAVPLMRVEGIVYANLTSLVEALEAQQLRMAMRQASGHRTHAAELLGITRFTLQRKLEKYGMGGLE